ncbi:sensor histidine kinase [Streptomyces sp. SAI-170]|uniref:sensor histidine kinase n=1 Tax=Streptomyces sp. SAI-170 TaxID=3377729 RepID=UPI003C7CF5E7
MLLLVVLLGSTFVTWLLTPGVSVGWLLTVVAVGLGGLVLKAARGVRATAQAIQQHQGENLAALVSAAAAVEKSALWSADELCRGARPPVPDRAQPRSSASTAQVEEVLAELHFQVVTSLIRVHDESQSVVLLEVLRRLAKREHALIGRALVALSELEKQTADPELLASIFQIDHLVTRARRHVESTAVLGGESLRRVRRPVSVTTMLRGAVSEVVDYPRVTVVAGPVGAELGFPGHVGPDLTHVLAELIENSCQYSDPATKVTVRAQRVPAGLAIEVEDRAVPMPAALRDQLNYLLVAPDEVDVSGQVRAGQLGLLTAAKIAQRHGLSIQLQENPTGGTTALVVVPTRLLVPIAEVDDALASRAAAPRPPASLPSPGSSSVSPGPSAARTAPSALAAGQVAGEGNIRHGAPALPRRSRTGGSFPPPAGREQAATAATPGLAAAYRRGVEAGKDGAPSSTAAEPTS